MPDDFYELELKDVTIKLGKQTVLNNASLAVNKGDFLTVLGANGSGKTTLIKTILGFYRPVNGVIKFRGSALTDTALKTLRNKTGYVPQHVSSTDNFPATAGDIIALGAGSTRADKWGRIMGIEGLMNKKFGSLSGGEKQKTILAMALSREPEMLLMDEPDQNLDIKAGKNFIKLVEKVWHETRAAVVYVTHFTSHIPACSTAVAVIRNGSITTYNNPSVLMKTRNIEEIIYG
jgi:ABC-type Mn2+/Zn2+ transport system ATPase subunit